MKRRAQIAFLAILFLIAPFGWYQMYQHWKPKPSAVHAELEAIAAMLADADRRGDKALAQEGQFRVSSLRNSMALNQAEMPRPCSLAASHLDVGFEELLRGGRWWSESRYRANLAECP